MRRASSQDVEGRCRLSGVCSSSAPQDSPNQPEEARELEYSQGVEWSSMGSRVLRGVAVAGIGVPERRGTSPLRGRGPFSSHPGLFASL